MKAQHANSGDVKQNDGGASVCPMVMMTVYPHIVQHNHRSYRAEKSSVQASRRHCGFSVTERGVSVTERGLVRVAEHRDLPFVEEFLKADVHVRINTMVRLQRGVHLRGAKPAPHDMVFECWTPRAPRPTVVVCRRRPHIGPLHRLH